MQKIIHWLKIKIFAALFSLRDEPLAEIQSKFSGELGSDTCLRKIYYSDSQNVYFVHGASFHNSPHEKYWELGANGEFITSVFCRWHPLNSKAVNIKMLLELSK